MTQTALQEIEGKLNAHRELLVALLAAALLDPESVSRTVQNLEQELLSGDGSEDPGATPSAGFARGAEKSEEIRTILAQARERAAGMARMRS
ncbi:hypothetical protein [Rhizobium sp. CAU 1783]